MLVGFSLDTPFHAAVKWCESIYAAQLGLTFELLIYSFKAWLTIAKFSCLIMSDYIDWASLFAFKKLTHSTECPLGHLKALSKL